MDAVLQRNILTDKYNNTKDLLHGIVWKFVKKYGGEFDDVLSEANFIFVECCNDHVESRSALTTWLTFKVWRSLQENKREEARQAKIIDKWGNSPRLERRMSYTNDFEVVDLLMDVEGDAKTIIRLAQNPPQKLVQKFYKQSNRPQGGHPYVFIEHMKNFLIDDMGWDANEVKKAFAEVKKAINDKTTSISS